MGRTDTDAKPKTDARHAALMTALSIIVPVFNEEERIVACLSALQAWRAVGSELIVVDGGSQDRTAALAEPWVDQLIFSPKGRAAQMNAGARQAQGAVLWFLHADSQPPADAPAQIDAALRASGRSWGRFDVRLSGRHPLLRMVETAMNLRSRLTGIATGDQGIFVRNTLFAQLGGYPDLALMEDIALSQLLKRHSRPVCLRSPLQTSSRRWEQDGILRTILLMWRLRLAYALGAAPDRLARRYYHS